MLSGVDRGLAIVSWLLAAAFAVMLLAGPEIVAEDKAKPKPAASTAPAAAPDGKALFASNCGSCHTLGAAGTSGSVGPKLDGIGLDAGAIQSVVEAGSGVMPSFKGRLSDPEIAAVAKFVAGN